jgi:hypothetical protein
MSEKAALPLALFLGLDVHVAFWEVLEEWTNLTFTGYEDPLAPQIDPKTPELCLLISFTKSVSAEPTSKDSDSRRLG